MKTTKTQERMHTLKKMKNNTNLENYHKIMRGALDDNENLVLELIGRGYDINKITEEVNVKEDTIKSYIKHIYQVYVIACLGSDDTNNTSNTKKSYKENLCSLESVATRIFIDKDNTMTVNSDEFIQPLIACAIATTYFRITHPLLPKFHLLHISETDEDGNETNKDVKEITFEFNKFFYNLRLNLGIDLAQFHFMTEHTDKEVLRYNARHELKPVKLSTRETREKTKEKVNSNYSPAFDFLQECICLYFNAILECVEKFPNSHIDLNREYKKEVEITYTTDGGNTITKKRTIKTSGCKQVSTGLIKYISNVTDPSENPISFCKSLDILDTGVYARVGSASAISNDDLIDFAIKYDLSEKQAQVVYLLAQNKSHKDIAELLDCSKSTIDTQVARAREHILKKTKIDGVFEKGERERLTSESINLGIDVFSVCMEGERKRLETLESGEKIAI